MQSQKASMWHSETEYSLLQAQTARGKGCLQQKREKAGPRDANEMHVLIYFKNCCPGKAVMKTILGTQAGGSQVGIQKSQTLPDQGESGQPGRTGENLVLRSPRTELSRSGTVKSPLSQDSCQAGDSVTLAKPLILAQPQLPHL